MARKEYHVRLLGQGSARHRAGRPRGLRRQQSGYILIVSLLVLLLMGIIGASLLRGNVTQEQVASNLAGKVRAQLAAQSALNYAETWLTVSRNASSGSPCSVGVVSNAAVVCNAGSPAPGTFDPNSLLVSTTAAGASGAIFAPPAMSVSVAGGANDYYQYPRYYIQFAGLVTDNSGAPVGSLYKITAGGYGGNVNEVAAVQAYYKVYAPATSTMGP